MAIDRHKQRASLTSLKHAVRLFRDLDGKMPVQAVHAFLEIALDEGVTITELMSRLDISLSSCSRNVSRLAHTNRAGEPGLGLVEPHPGPDPRAKLLYLTTAGRELVAKLTDRPTPATR